MKLAWEAAHGNVAAATDADGLRGAGGGPSGLTMADLLAARPAVAFPWGPATRCYSPHLHAAEQCVAQRSLQRAGGYREPTSRRLSKIRRWLEGNQAVTGGHRAGSFGGHALCRPLALACPLRRPLAALPLPQMCS